MVHLKELTIDLKVSVMVAIFNFFELEGKGSGTLGDSVGFVDDSFESEFDLVLPADKLQHSIVIFLMRVLVLFVALHRTLLALPNVGDTSHKAVDVQCQEIFETLFQF